VNLTDGDSRIMPVSGGGFAQAYNAQATVTMGSLLIVGTHVTQNANDKQESRPGAGGTGEAAGDRGNGGSARPWITVFTARTTWKSWWNTGSNLHRGGRQPHQEALEERLAPVPEAPNHPDAVGAMKHRLKTKEGKPSTPNGKARWNPCLASSRK